MTVVVLTFRLPVILKKYSQICTPPHSNLPGNFLKFQVNFCVHVIRYTLV